ncbi:MAG: DNA internalization-related competence protein ComEC/Rec2 [Bacilli bacterium]
MKKLRNILQSKYLLKIFSILFLISSLIFTKHYQFTSKYTFKDNTFTGVIYNYKIEDKKLTLYIKGKEKLIINYAYDDSISINSLSYGDKVLVKGTLEEISSNNIPNTFNYKKYLYNKKIYYIVTATSIDKLENNSNYFYTIKNLINKRIKNLKSKPYIQTLLLGNNTINKEVRESYQINGLSHLFSISGMHLSLFIRIIYLYLDRVSYHKKAKHLITNIFLIFYLCIAYSSSLLRSVIMNIILSINSIFKLNISKTNIMCITLIISIIVNPFIIYDIGFIYSYTITFFLIIFSRKYNSKIKNIISTAIISFIVSFPITTYYNYEINFLTIIMNIFLVPLVSTIILPFTILTFIFPFLDNILFFVLSKIESISLFFSQINFFKVIFPKINIFFIILYYLLIIILLKRKKNYYLLIICIIIHYFLPFLDNNLKITTFDIGQGDSHLISFPNNKGNILIDTGYSDYKVKNGIIPYLKSIGISKISYLIITHGDEDHIGGAITLVNNFKVDKVIFNCGTYNDLEKELTKVLDNKNIKYHSCIKELNIDKYKLEFLNTKEYDNENDNSNVIYLNYNNYKFLFMGDAGTEKEKDILEKYYLKDIDFLKIGHHGSNTSSSKYFIDSINPKYSLISVGKNNRYGHPKDSVLDILSNSKIYRTDIDGSIEIKLNKNGCKIRTCQQ